MADIQGEEISIPEADTSCGCSESGGSSICSNCMTNHQRAIKKGGYYDSEKGKFFKKI